MSGKCWWLYPIFLALFTRATAQSASLEIDLVAPLLSKVGASLSYAPNPSLGFRFYYQRRLKKERFLPYGLVWENVVDRGNQFELETAYTYRSSGGRLIARVGVSAIHVRREVLEATTCALVWCFSDNDNPHHSAFYIGPSGGLTGLILPNVSLDVAGGIALGLNNTEVRDRLTYLQNSRAWIRISAGVYFDAFPQQELPPSPRN